MPSYHLYVDGEKAGEHATGDAAYQFAQQTLTDGFHHVAVVRVADDGHEETLFDGHEPPWGRPTPPLRATPRDRLSPLAELALVKA